MARAAAMAGLQNEKDVTSLLACENRPWTAKSDERKADLTTAFPSTEHHCEEHFNVGVIKGERLYYTYYLIPQHSYMWDKVRYLWDPEAKPEPNSWEDTVHNYQ
jgi:hypothetical protein